MQVSHLTFRLMLNLMKAMYTDKNCASTFYKYFANTTKLCRRLFNKALQAEEAYLHQRHLYDRTLLRVYHILVGSESRNKDTLRFHLVSPEWKYAQRNFKESLFFLSSSLIFPVLL